MKTPDASSRFYPFPWNAPQSWRGEAIAAYEQYLDEREADIAAGVEPSTDEVEPWLHFLSEYLFAELEGAAK